MSKRDIRFVCAILNGHSRGNLAVQLYYLWKQERHDEIVDLLIDLPDDIVEDIESKVREPHLRLALAKA